MCWQSWKRMHPLVCRDSYCVVNDTIIEDLPDDMFPDRPWCKGDNPKTAVWEYLKAHTGYQYRQKNPAQTTNYRRAGCLSEE